MQTATAKTGNGAPAALESIAGNANERVSSEEIKFCAHINCGCISQSGYRCMKGGHCQPVDSEGRRFVVQEWLDNGQRLTTRHFLDDFNCVPLHREGNKAICGGRCMCQPEDHGGKGACGKVLGAFDPKTNAGDMVAS